MKSLLAALLLAALSLAAPADARQSPRHDYSRQVGEPSESDLQTHKHYRSRDGSEVHSPSKTNSGRPPSGASAQCRDGSYSFSHHARGTCSHHGGVASW
jgi:hypothetical protein